MKKDKLFEKEQLEKLIVDVKNYKGEDGVVVVMCECAFGDTASELKLMSESIKRIVRAGGIVHIIK